MNYSKQLKIFQEKSTENSVLDSTKFFNRCKFVDKNGNFSNNFINLAKSQSSLTFNKKYLDINFKDIIETPFEEITLADPLTLPENANFSKPQIFQKSYDEYLDAVLAELKDFLLTLDPKENYLFSHSSGSDSRIISGVMKQIKDTGQRNFDNILFYCWGRPEEASFRKIMKFGGWDNFVVNDDSIPNAFEIGVEDFSVDGWNTLHSQMKFWGKINPSEYILLSGAEGETFLRPYEKWVHSKGFFNERGESIHRLCKIFKGGIFPFLSYGMLNLIMSMPDEWRNLKDERINRDKIRTDLVEKLGLINIPVDRAYYNFNITEDRKKQMIDLYEKSKFKSEFGVKIDFDEFFDKDKFLQNTTSYNSKVWAFAVTVYEKIM